MIKILVLAVPLLLLAALVPSAVALLRHWTHPTRLALEALTTCVTLVFLIMVVPLTSWLMILWWAVLALFVSGAVVATWRATTPPPSLGEGASSRAQASAQPVGTRALLGNGLLWAAVVALALLGG